jgi:cellulose synthase/poly-beta-1,6-N-acetylglucosamine synthase-like glycosyltransferase
MVAVSEILFWASLFIIFYTYIGYPILLFIAVKVKRSFWASNRYKTSANEYPDLTMIIPAFNEENILRQKIANTLEIDYPSQKLNIIFVTDGSTDNSNDIIKQYTSLQLLFEPVRRGKLAAMNRAVTYVKTEIIIFSDANTLLNKDCIKKLLPHFNDPKVGGVAGEKKIFKEDGVAAGEGAYWKYESLLKKFDSELYSVVGAAGELFSIRTSLYTPLREDLILDDFVQSLLLCKKGYVVRYEPEAFALERASFSLTDEKERKIRISAGGFQAIGYLKGLFNVFRYGILSFQYISHRVLRWTLCPLSLLVALGSSLCLHLSDAGNFYGFAFAAQALFYFSAAGGALIPVRALYIPFYFTFINFCVFAGFMRHVSGRQKATWQKAAR